MAALCALWIVTEVIVFALFMLYVDSNVALVWAVGTLFGELGMLLVYTYLKREARVNRS